MAKKKDDPAIVDTTQETNPSTETLAGDPPAEKEETAAERFHRLATSRTSRIIDGIRTLPALANKKVYEYLPDHPGKIFETIEAELSDAKRDFARISEEGAGRQKSFSL